MRGRRLIGDKGQLEMIDDPVHNGILREESGDLHAASVARGKNPPLPGLNSRGIPFPSAYPVAGDDPPPVPREKNFNDRDCKPAQIFIGNIDFNVSLLELEELLKPYGPVLRLAYPFSHSLEGAHRGFAFATLDPQQVDAAIMELNGFVLHDRKLRVERAVERPQERKSWER